ncbi:prepilin-type N-terminal cleavage/methylation domain-containing protein [Candidatus Sumerlaeota bacterium]|nr:prepilin-type N-terminal cleavage/methylation domain-containing protein [Candidatus Sumerlaeota bacterium]
MRPRFHRAFTLIELLIVVAIIAILAAIAVPNFLEAQTRAKVARVRSDMRSLATALESYRVDANAYPDAVDINTFVTTNLVPGYAATPRINRMVILTTPVAYMTSIPLDAFGDREIPLDASADLSRDQVFIYYGNEVISYRGTDYRPRSRLHFREFDVVGAGGSLREPLWALFSQGPDTDFDTYDAADQTTLVIEPFVAVIQPYDPTNGTISDGDLARFRQ